MMTSERNEKTWLEPRHVKVDIYLKPQEKDRVFEIKTLLEQNPSQHYTIPQLSKKALMNDYKLKRAFRFLFGKSIHDFHLQVRMHEAERLLINTEERLESIAENTGYNHLSSFIAQFKKLHSMTPATFRRNNKH